MYQINLTKLLGTLHVPVVLFLVHMPVIIKVIIKLLKVNPLQHMSKLLILCALPALK